MGSMEAAVHTCGGKAGATQPIGIGADSTNRTGRPVVWRDFASLHNGQAEWSVSACGGNAAG